jgi:hypothetical protein
VHPLNYGSEDDGRRASAHESSYLYIFFTPNSQSLFILLQDKGVKMIENNQQHRTRNIVLKIVAVVVLLAVIAGAACLAFKLGERHALNESAYVLNGQNEQGEYERYNMPMNRSGYIQGYGRGGFGMHGMGFGGGIFMFFGGLFVFFLILWAIRMLFWGPRWHHRFPYPMQGQMPQDYSNQAAAAPVQPVRKTVAAKPAAVKKGKK